MKIINNFFLVIIFSFFNVFYFAQESEGGTPLFSKSVQDHKNNEDGSNRAIVNSIPTFLSHVDNLKEVKKTDSIKSSNNSSLYMNYYGKVVPIGINFLKEAKIFEYEGKIVCLYKIKSENAYSIQVNFSKFKLPTSSKFFIYNSDGMVLGSFSDKNIFKKSLNSNNIFVTQPIKGNEVFLELNLENREDIDLIEVEVSEIMHGFRNLYGSDGPFSQDDATTFTNCNKNVSCTNNAIDGYTYSTDINKGNMKSVGLMLIKNATFGSICSGTLINNVKQDGTPYFLTAEHCIKNTINNPVFLNETVIVFNHETKNCTDSGDIINGDLNSPSTNSVVGAQLLTSVGITENLDGSNSTFSQDFALLKLNTTPEILKKYRVCYSGWSNLQFPSNINRSYTVHHPAGTVKKISITNQNITPTNYSAIYSDSFSYENPNVYFSKNFSTNLSQGYFLAAEFSNGFPYHGSSGAPLFTRDGYIIGTLSSGPSYETSNSTPTKPVHILVDDPFKSCGTNRSNQAKYNVLYSRFWRDYLFMQTWLNPESLNIQSIGNYCPAGIGGWGSVDASSGPSGSQECAVETEILSPDYFSETYKDLNGYRVRPLSTYGKKMYIEKLFSTDVNKIITSEKLITLDLSKCNNLNYINNLYKVIGNKLEKIESVSTIMKNAVYWTGGNMPPYTGNIVGVTNERVYVIFQQLFDSFPGNPDLFKYGKLELQTYKVIDNSLVEESVYNVFPDYTTLNSLYSNIKKITPIFINENCIYLLIEKNGTNNYLHRLRRETVNDAWLSESFTNVSINNNTFLTVIDNLLFSHTYAGWGDATQIKTLLIYNLDASQNPSVIKTYNWYDTETFKKIIKSPDGNFELFYTINDGSNSSSVYSDRGLRIKKINLNNIIDTYDIFPISGLNTIDSFSVNSNDMIVGLNNSTILNYGYRDPNTSKWVLSNKNLYFNASKSGFLYPKYTFMDDNFFINNITWDINVSGSNGYTNKLLTALNVINVNDLKDISTDVENDASGAYVVLNNLERIEWKKSNDGSKMIYDNIDNNIINDGNWIVKTGMNSNGQSSPLYVEESYPMYNAKTLILSDQTAHVTGNKSISLQALHSIVMKPGFEISSNSGVEFKAKATSTKTYPESLTYDDMLHPELGDYHDQLSKQNIIPEIEEADLMPIYGEIVWNQLLNAEKENVKTIFVYPNPVNDILNIKNVPVGSEYQIINMLGQVVKKSRITNDNINVENLTSGLYILKIDKVKIKIIKK